MTRNLTQVAGSFIGTMEEFHTSEKKPLVSPIIHITDSQTAKILDTIPLGEFWDDNHHKSLKDTLEYFEFRTFGDKRYSQYLEKMNRIIIPDEDGTFIEFVIFHAIKYRLQSAVVVDVYAPASYLLLKKAKVIKPQRVSEYSASQHLGFALNGTEWRPGIVESDEYRTLDIENHTNPYAYIKRIANEFELEPRFRVETDGNKVIGRYVDLLERVGQWQGREVEFGRDLLGIERKVDDSNVVTALIGLGPERDDGTRLEVFIEDEEALQRWGIPNPQTGELMHLIETYEPESTDQDMTVDRLTELTRNELEKRINSVVEYTADVADLEKVPGMENKVIRFGDTIKIKDVGFNPPLYLEARVHTQDRSLSQPEKKKVTLGDYIEYTEEEVHAIWKQLQAEIAKKVSMAQVTEVVYTKTEVDERDDAVREHADNVAENAKIEAIQVAAEDASKKAKQAEDSAKEYTDGRLQNTVAKDIFENTVTDLLNNIAQKVDSTRFEQVENELRGIAEGLQREIEEHADMLEEHGGKITKLETDVDEVAGKINATISELEELGDTVSRHETQIDANAQAIALKADKQELDLLSGTVSDINSQLTVMAGQIEAKAERSEVEKLENDVTKVSQDVSKLTIDVDGIKTNVGSISQTVSNHGTQISNINSTLTQHADMIATKVEKSEFDSVTNSLGNRISTIEQTADSISLEVSDIKANVYTKGEVDSAIDDIKIGGRNYFRPSLVNNLGWINTDGGQIGQGRDWRGYYIQVKPGEVYSISRDSLSNNRFGVYFTEIEPAPGVATLPTFYRDDNALKIEGMKVPDGANYLFVYLSNQADDIPKIKLEKGNKATDWTPAPEDIDEKFTDIEGTLASHSTKIEQNAQQIQLRATKAEVDTLSGRVRTVESTIQQHADMIATKVSRTEFESLQIGGRNLLLDSNDFTKFDRYMGATVNFTTGVSVPEWNATDATRIQISGGTSVLKLYKTVIAPSVSGQDYTVSVWIKNIGSYPVVVGNNLSVGPMVNPGESKRVIITSKGNGTSHLQVQFRTTTGNENNPLDFIAWRAKAEHGNRATDWTPAPEDVQEQIDGLGSRLSTAETSITQLSDQIILKANQSEVDALSGRVNQAESQITQLAGQIELRATKTEVDALSGRVSTVESTIQQHADMIETKIDDGQARSIFRQEASSFTFEADQINFEGHVFGEDATFTGKIVGSEIQGANITGATITGTEINGSIINSVYLFDSIRIGEGLLTAEYRYGSTYTLQLGGWGISFTISDSDEHGWIGLRDPLYDQMLHLYHNKKLRLQAPVIEMFGVGGDSNILEFVENTDVQQIRFNTSNDGRIYFGRYGSDDGWALIGNQSRIAIYDYEYGGAFPIVVRRSPKAVEVNGSFSVSGTKSAVVDTENYGRRLMYAVEAPDNRFMDVIEGVFETGEYWILLNRMFAETINGYSVFPIPQGKGIAKILKKETDRFKVYVESEEPVEIAFWIYGKRKGYEGIYMEEVTDFEEGIA